LPKRLLFLNFQKQRVAAETKPGPCRVTRQAKERREKQLRRSTEHEVGQAPNANQRFPEGPGPRPAR